MKTILLIAGNGDFPVLFAKNAREKNIPVICLAINSETDPVIEEHVEKTYWLNVTDFQQFFDIIKREKIKKAVMVGKITKKDLIKDEQKIRSKIGWFLKILPDRKDDSMLRGVAKVLALKGVRVLSSTLFLKDHLAKKGPLTQRAPTECQWRDIHFGRAMIRRIGALDIGQSIVVKNKAVIAVEAIEGTDEAIKRAGELAGEDTVVVKIAKPHQDMRFDIPVIGPGTIANMIKSGAKTLAVESGKTLVLNKEDVIKSAEENGISIVGI